MNAQVASYIEALSPSQQETLLFLRKILFDNCVQLEEKFRYKVPFYDYFGMCFYLIKKNAGVELGFCEGHQLEDSDHLLTSQHLAVVRHYRVDNIHQIETEALSRLIQQALMINEAKPRKKKKPLR
jgi:hypothetical protein